MENFTLIRINTGGSYEGVKPRRALMPHVSNDMIARRNFGTPEQLLLKDIRAKKLMS
jgi:hypothetical protein